jgi:energy-coupling factor transport system ATP-binding protein
MIEFKDVTFVHSTGTRALDHVNLAIGEAQTVAIVGENGAGKTTLVKHITGLLKPTSGVVIVDGADTRQKTTAELSRKVGVAFQNPDHQLFSESVEEEIAFALRNFGFSNELINQRIDWSLNFFGLSEYRKSSPLTLSGGEKKRLTIACILSWDPKVVVLDEPTVGQDSIQKEKLSETIKMLQSTGKTVIIVSHDIEFLWPMQPRMIVMSKGKVIADGPAPELMLQQEILSNARVSQPQLVSLYQILATRPPTPFVDVVDARNWIATIAKRR